MDFAKLTPRKFPAGVKTQLIAGMQQDQCGHLLTKLRTLLTGFARRYPF